MVVIDAEPLDAVIDPYEATEDGAPLIYDNVKNNISVREATVHGDVEGALNSAAIRDQGHRSAHRGARRCRWRVARSSPQPDAILGGLTFWTSTQAPHWNRNDIAKALGLSQSKVRAIAPEVGGGFGAKIGTYPEEFVICAAAHAAQAAGQVDREPSLRISSPRITAATSGPSSRPARTQNGKVTALKARVRARLGRLSEGARPRLGDLDHGDRPIRHPEPRLRSARRLHQHDGQRRLSRRWSAGSGLSTSSGSWT